MLYFETDFAVGQVVRHRRFRYRGVVVSADPSYQLSEEWYRKMARSRPPKDRPWYRLFIDGSDQMSYVAERSLELDGTREPVEHPLLEEHFDSFEDGVYRNRRQEV